MMKLFFFVKMHFVKEFLCSSLLLMLRRCWRERIVVTRGPNLPSNKKVRSATTQKKFEKKIEKKRHARTNVHVEQIIKYSLIYCDVFHQWSSMMWEKPWWTIMLLLPSLPCTHIFLLRNHHQYCSDSSKVCKVLYRLACCCLFSSCASFCTGKEIFRRGGNCWGHRCYCQHIYTNIDHGHKCIEVP